MGIQRIPHDEPLWPGFDRPRRVVCRRGSDRAGNDRYILQGAQETGKVIVAVLGGFENRCHAVLELLAGRDVMCLKKTTEGYPIHPLYVAAHTEPITYES